MARIEFNDGEAAVLSSDHPTPADRFASWTPMTRPHGDVAHTLADETLHRFTLRTDYGATFELRGLHMGSADDSALDIAERLVVHLLNGGTCAVYTDDKISSQYTNCGLWPDSTPSLVQADARDLDYTLSLSLLNLAGARMIAHYDA